VSALPDLLQAAAAAREGDDPHRLRAALGALHRALHDRLPRDPLVAASCLALIDDDELAALLTPIADRARPRVGRANALVVDGEGRGRVVEVLVELSPGGAGAWTPQAVERDAAVAAQLAVAVGLGAQASRWGVRWQLRGVDRFALRGTSIGLAVAVATRAARDELQLPEGWAFTGGVDLDGTVAPVAGLPAKVHAAAAAGLTHAAVPATSRPGLRAPKPLALVGAAHIDELLAILAPAPPRTRRSRWRRWAPLAALLLPVAAAWTEATDFAEGPLQTPLLRALSAPLPADNTAILTVPPQQDLRALRASWPAVLDRLVEAGATCITLDLFFSAETEDDPAFAAAVERAADQDVPVVVPGRWRDGALTPPGSPALAAATRPAIAEFKRDFLLGWVRFAPVFLRDDDGEDHWHLAVESLRGHLGAGPATMSGDTLAIGVTRNPTWHRKVYLPPVAPSPTLDWTGNDWSDAAGRVVLIGVGGATDDLFRTPSGRRYGVELHAATVEALARQAAPRIAEPEVAALAAALIGLLTAALTALLPRRLRAVVLIVPVAGLVILAALAAAGILVALLPVLLAVGVGGVVGSGSGGSGSGSSARFDRG